MFNSAGLDAHRTSPRSISASASAGVRGIGVADDAGKEVPFQIEEATQLRGRRPEDGADRLRGARHPGAGLPRLPRRRTRSARKRGDSRELGRATSSRTRSYRVTFDRATGAIKSLRVKPDDWEVFVGPGRTSCRGKRTRAISGSLTAGWTAAARSP